MTDELWTALKVAGGIVLGALMLHARRLTVWSWAIIAAVLSRGG